MLQPAEIIRPRRGNAVLRLATVAAMVIGVTLAASPAAAQTATPQRIIVKQKAAPETPAPSRVETNPEPWTGDLDGMKDRQVIRILVPYSKTLFFYDKEKEMGVLHEMGLSLEKWANTHADGAADEGNIRIVFVPVAEDRLLPDLKAGLGDIAAGGLTTEPEGMIGLELSGALAPNSGAVIVTRKRGDPVPELERLSGRQVAIHATSAAYLPLRQLSDKMVAEGKRPINLITVPEELQDEDLLQMVNGGLLSVAVVDGYVAAFWSQVLSGIVVRDDLLDYGGNELAWAVREDSPQLKRLMEGFLARNKPSTFAAASLKKYLGDTALPNNATADGEMVKFNQAIDMFKKYGDAYDLDHLMMMALGYQESRLNQKARNPYGPVGMMQITQATAATSVVGIRGIEKDAGRNVEAAAKYLRYIADSYLADPNMDQTNRTLMAFVGYNAGPKNLERVRDAAVKSGLNPNVWFNNVELAAAQTLGRKSVEYVSNIYKYYTAYRVAVGDPALREKSVNGLEPPKGGHDQAKAPTAP